MNKFFLFIMSLCATLCSIGIYAQEAVRQVISIDRMFSLADQNSKSLRPALSGISEAQEGVKIAKSARMPDIDVSLSFSYLGDGYMFDRNFSNGFNAPMPHFGNNLAIEASQVVYSGGAIPNSIKIARLQEEKAKLDLENNRNRLRFMLIGYYLDLFKQKNMLQVYEKNIEQTRQVLKDIHAKGDEGIVLKNDITRYELLLSNLELTRIQIKNSLTILNTNLTTTLGLPQNTWIEPDTTILDRSIPTEGKEYWANTAFGNSPSLKQLSLAVDINKHQNKIIKSERLPQIGLFAGDKLDGPIIIEVPPINQNFNYWYFGVGIKYNIASLYKTNKSVAKSKLAIQRTLELYDDAKEQTELAVKADYIKYLEAYEQLNTRIKGVELAKQNYSVIHNRYNNGMALITDMLDASNAKLTSEVELVNAQINIVFDYYKLLFISGTL